MKTEAQDKARAAWGEALPEWVLALAAACDRDGGRAVAERIGYSRSAVSLVINNRWNGDLTRIEQAVRGALMNAEVACPVVGALALDRCATHQKAAWAPHNPQRIQFYRACRSGCPHSNLKGGDAC